MLKGHSNTVRSVAFSADGRRIVSGSDDNSVRVWDAASGAALEVSEHDERWLKERGGRAGKNPTISPLGTLRWTLPDGRAADLALLPGDGFILLTKPPQTPRWQIAATRGEYWRHVHHATDDARGRILWPAELADHFSA